jgi:hypothetical protein
MPALLKIVRDYHIEKGIPKPPTRLAKIDWPFERMEVGDSVLIPAERWSSAASKVNDMKKDGYRFVRRKVAEGYRFWRVE